jgi:hypothetical protein
LAVVAYININEANATAMAAMVVADATALVVEPVPLATTVLVPDAPTLAVLTLVAARADEKVDDKAGTLDGGLKTEEVPVE